MSAYRNCKYYYSNEKVLSGGEVSGVAIGAIVGMILFIVLIVCCCKRCQQKKLEEAMQKAQANAQNQMQRNNLNITTQNLATEYQDPNQQFMYQGQPSYGQPIAPIYGQAYGQPLVQQPGYGGYNQPQTIYTQPMQPTPVYFQPTDQQVPIPPVPPNLFGPSPIVR